MHTRRTFVPVAEPFELGLSIKFLAGFSPMIGEVALGECSLDKTWMHRGRPIAVTVRAERAGLACALRSPEPIDDEAEHAIADRVAFFLSATDDVEAFYALAEHDEPFAPVARRLRGLHHPKFPTPFESACWAVINQRVPLAQARKMKAAIVAKWGAARAFPEAATLAKASLAELGRTIGNERKARAVFAVSQAFAKRDEKWLQTAPIAEVESWLRSIWGVGDFSVAFILYRGLGRSLPPPLGLPWSDKFVDAAKETYGRATRADLEKKAAHYGPWTGYWSLYLWGAGFV
ncbi:MAG TPA: hypothetical protein VGH28_08695 [Polyangiaceae bacterium]|jgi:DNA-3-methyladenine glycosylase II